MIFSGMLIVLAAIYLEWDLLWILILMLILSSSCARTPNPALVSAPSKAKLCEKEISDYLDAGEAYRICKRDSGGDSEESNPEPVAGEDATDSTENQEKSKLNGTD